MYRKEEKHDVGSLVAAQNEVRPVTLWLAPFTHRLAGLVYTSMDTIQAYFTVQAPPPPPPSLVPRPFFATREKLVW